jgi:adenine-specific DNA-methyltransferase
MPEIVFKGKEYVYNHHLTVPYRPLQPQADKGIGAPDLAVTWSFTATTCTR